MIRALRTALLAASLLAAPAVFAGDVYQWKDANGVTHYSQTPPAQGKYQMRTISHRDGSGPAQAAPAAPQQSPQCATALRNIELLQSGKQLQLDSNGDGQADHDLDDDGRQKQLDIAQTVARVNCGQAKSAP
jgi:hypothetical protein